MENYIYCKQCQYRKFDGCCGVGLDTHRKHCDWYNPWGMGEFYEFDDDEEGEEE